MASKRANILTLIRCEVATEGKITATAIRLYVENRCIGRAAFNDAAGEGMKIFKAKGGTT